MDRKIFKNHVSCRRAAPADQSAKATEFPTRSNNRLCPGKPRDRFQTPGFSPDPGSSQYPRRRKTRNAIAANPQTNETFGSGTRRLSPIST
jgi:hypothetical protein